VNVATITMDREEARAKLDEYRAGLALRDDAEYERLVEAYSALAKGSKLLVLSNVIANAPRDDRGRPRLAIARADKRQVKYRRDRNRPFETFSTRENWRQRALDLDLNVPVVAGLTPDFPRPANPEMPWQDSVREGFALVPLVPPGIRGRRALNTHFILWEVEAWAGQAIRAQPDLDPYLLKRVGDDLFAVVGEWDLTEVERAILADRRTP
jgi:hypothetical protein